MSKRSNKLLWIVGFTALVGSFVAIPLFLANTRPPPTDDQNCRRDGIVPAHSVVLIDQSDPFAESDVDWVWKALNDEARTIAKHGRLSVLGIDPERPDDGVEVFSRCSPGSADQANPMFENPEFIEADWTEMFEKTMKARVAELMLERKAPESPIAENIKGILRRSDFQQTVPLRRIIVISDFHQNSQGFSHYREGVNIPKFLSYLDMIDFPSLSNVEFAFYRVDRKGNLSAGDLRAFWKETLEKRGSTNVRFVRE